MYQIEYEKKALRKLLKMPANQRKLIISKLLAYAKSPETSTQVVRLTGREGYRMRVGDWRVIFDRHDDKLMVMVLDVGSRGGIYK